MALLTLAVSLGTAAPAVAQTASLTGETLESQEAVPGHETSFGDDFTCNKNGTTTFTYETTGTAGGPYVGTFFESGTITIGPQTNTAIDSRGVGAILAFEADFSIDSLFPPATVTGSKSLASAADEPTLARFGRCEPDGGEPPTAVFALISTADVLYEATIDAATGTRSDSGNAGLFIEASSVPGTTTFLESFTSTEPVPEDCDEDEQGDNDCQGEDDDEQ